MVSGSKGSAQRDPPEGRSVRCRRLSRKVNSFFYTTLASASCVAYYTELPILPRRSSPPVSPFQEVPAGAAHGGSPRAVGRSAQHVERPLRIHARNTHLRQQLPCAPAFCARKTVRASMDAPAAL